MAPSPCPVLLYSSCPWVHEHPGGLQGQAEVPSKGTSTSSRAKVESAGRYICITVGPKQPKISLNFPTITKSLSSLPIKSLTPTVKSQYLPMSCPTTSERFLCLSVHPMVEPSGKPKPRPRPIGFSYPKNRPTTGYFKGWFQVFLVLRSLPRLPL
jgi:hypothetical protein